MTTNGFTMGVTPAAMSLRLSADADFITTIATADGSNWPGTVGAELRFGDGTVWPATVVGAEMQWDVAFTAVNTLLSVPVSGQRTVRLFYIDGSTEIEWAQGGVIVS